MSHSATAIRRLSGLLLLCGAASATFTPLRALDTDGVLVPGDPNDFVILSSLLGQQAPSVTVGDKAFSQFVYSPTGEMPPATNINVFGFEDPNGHFGLTVHGAFFDLAGGASSQATLGFTVGVTPAALAQGNRISDAHLFLNGWGFGDESVVVITESSRRGRIFLEAFESTRSGEEAVQQSDSAVFDDTYQSLRATMTITATTGLGVNQPARVTAFDASFSQIVVPEPAAALLMLAGCGALVLGRDRRRLFE